MISTRDRMAELTAKKPRRTRQPTEKRLPVSSPARATEITPQGGSPSHCSRDRDRSRQREGTGPGPARGPRDAPAAPLAARSSRRAPRASRRYTDEPDARRRVETPRSPDGRLRLTKDPGRPAAPPQARAFPAPAPRARPPNTPVLHENAPRRAPRERAFHQSPSRQREACSQHPRHRAPISPQKNHPFFLQRSGPRASRSSTRWLWRTRSSRRSSPR